MVSPPHYVPGTEPEVGAGSTICGPPRSIANTARARRTCPSDCRANQPSAPTNPAGCDSAPIENRHDRQARGQLRQRRTPGPPAAAGHCLFRGVSLFEPAASGRIGRGIPGPGKLAGTTGGRCPDRRTHDLHRRTIDVVIRQHRGDLASASPVSASSSALKLGGAMPSLRFSSCACRRPSGVAERARLADLRIDRPRLWA